MKIETIDGSKGSTNDELETEDTVNSEQNSFVDVSENLGFISETATIIEV